MTAENDPFRDMMALDYMREEDARQAADPPVCVVGQASLRAGGLEPGSPEAWAAVFEAARRVGYTRACILGLGVRDVPPRGES